MKKTNPDISVIVPVYNSERFLRKCLNSIVAQTFKNFEVIIIDDGSTDASVQIIKEYVSTHKNFVFLSQPHSGQGVARNLGIKKARGEYVSFVDSDDYVHEHFLERLYSSARENDADISCCSMNLYYPHNGFKIPFPSKRIKQGVYDKTFAFRKVIEDLSLNSFPCDKLFRRKLFQNEDCQFRNMYFEDMVLIPKLFFYANGVVIIQDTLYNYSQHRYSTVGTMNNKKISDFILSLKFTKEFLQGKNCYSLFQKEFERRVLKARMIISVTIFKVHFLDFSFKNFFKDLSSVVEYINVFVLCNESSIVNDMDYKLELFSTQ